MVKNKPKRLNRNRSWRVMRRKKRINKLVEGSGRNRKPRPKNKKTLVEKVVEKIKPAEKKVIKKAVKKAAKKE